MYHSASAGVAVWYNRLMFCSNCGSAVADGASFCNNCGARMTAVESRAATSAPVGTGAAAIQVPVAMNYAPWGTRVIGGIIDYLFVFAAVVVLNIFFGGIFGGLNAGLSAISGDHIASPVCCFWVFAMPAGSLLVGLFNKVYLVAQRGYSVGQGVAKVKTVDANGNLLTQTAALIRLLVQSAFTLVPFLPLLDLLWPLWDERRQTLHDKASNAYVILNG
jgi:uncharacterized RDD family membrane protein YckC